MNKLASLTIAAWLLIPLTALQAAAVANLRCKYLKDPLGIDVAKLTMDVTIPSNTTATVFVPAKDSAGVTESGKPADKVEGVTFQRMENGSAVYAMVSGSCQFRSLLLETFK
jgi:hypothetical protein